MHKHINTAAETHGQIINLLNITTQIFARQETVFIWYYRKKVFLIRWVLSCLLKEQRVSGELGSNSKQSGLGTWTLDGQIIWCLIDTTLQFKCTVHEKYIYASVSKVYTGSFRVSVIHWTLCALWQDLSNKAPLIISMSSWGDKRGFCRIHLRFSEFEIFWRTRWVPNTYSSRTSSGPLTRMASKDDSTKWLHSKQTFILTTKEQE